MHISRSLLPLDPFEHPPDLAEQIHSNRSVVIELGHQQNKNGHGEFVVHGTGFKVRLFTVELAVAEFELLVEEREFLEEFGGDEGGGVEGFSEFDAFFVGDRFGSWVVGLGFGEDLAGFDLIAVS